MKERGDGCTSPWHDEEPDLVSDIPSLQKSSTVEDGVAEIMAANPSVQEPGGFLPSYLPSPSISTNRSPSIEPSHLPQTRSHPLKSGSGKESSVIYYLDDKLLAISRRYEKRVQVVTEMGLSAEGEAQGYRKFSEAARDLDAVIDVVWVTGTPTLQTPYLLTIALAVCSYLPSFPFSPRPTFRLLHKLDLAFASLLQGTNAETGQRLSGFEGVLGARGIDTTKKVRMKGVVERTRLAVVEVAGKDGSIAESLPAEPENPLTTDEDTSMEDYNDDFDDDMQEDEHYGHWEMEIAHVYERTIVLLGESLDASAIGKDT